jgi:hypothetical protein
MSNCGALQPVAPAVQMIVAPTTWGLARSGENVVAVQADPPGLVSRYATSVYASNAALDPVWRAWSSKV